MCKISICSAIPRSRLLSAISMFLSMSMCMFFQRGSIISPATILFGGREHGKYLQISVEVLNKYGKFI